MIVFEEGPNAAYMQLCAVIPIYSARVHCEPQDPGCGDPFADGNEKGEPIFLVDRDVYETISQSDQLLRLS